MRYSCEFPDTLRAQQILMLMKSEYWPALVEELELRAFKATIDLLITSSMPEDFEFGKKVGFHAAVKTVTRDMAKEMQVRIDKAVKESEDSA